MYAARAMTSNTSNGGSNGNAVALKVSKTDETSLARWKCELRLLRRLSDSRAVKSQHGKAYIMGLVQEFGGDGRLPGSRFLATTPLCWGSLERRIQVKGVVGWGGSV